MTIDNYGSRKQTSKSIYSPGYGSSLIVIREEAAAVEEVVVGVEVEEGEAVDAGVVAGKTIESALKRLTNTTRSSNDTTTAFWAWKTRKDTTSGLH